MHKARGGKARERGEKRERERIEIGVELSKQREHSDECISVVGCPGPKDHNR